MSTRATDEGKGTRAYRYREASKPVHLRYDGIHSLPGRPPVEVWTILEGPAAGASFSIHPGTQDIREQALRTMLRFLPPARPPPRPSTFELDSARPERSSP